jgi:Tfp pilus assembly protein FimT
MRTHRINGYSLIEILIVVSLILLAGLILVPGIRSHVPRYNLDGAVSALVAELRAARVQASSEARPVVVDLNPKTLTLTIKIDRNGNHMYESDETSTLNLSDYKGLTLNANSVNGTFMPRGMFRSPTGFWKIDLKSSDGEAKFIYVFAGGQIQSSDTSLE